MSQAIEIQCLSEDQALRTVENLCKVRGLDKPKIISKEKPSFSKEIVQKYKKRTILIEDGCIKTDTSAGGYLNGID